MAAVTNYCKLSGLTEIYCLPVLEAGSPRSRCQYGHAPSEGARETLFQAFLLVPASSLASDSMIPIFTWDSPSVHVCVDISPFDKDTSHVGLEVHSMPVEMSMTSS